MSPGLSDTWQPESTLREFQCLLPSGQVSVVLQPPDKPKKNSLLRVHFIALLSHHKNQGILEERGTREHPDQTPLSVENVPR